MFNTLFSASLASAWRYNDTAGWGDACLVQNGDGDYQQSPVALINADAVSGGGYLSIETSTEDFTFSTLFKIEMMGDKVELAFDYEGDNLSSIRYAAGTDSTDVKVFDLLSAHIHVGGAEHTVDGKATNGTYHFVHKASDDKYAVIELPFVYSGDVASPISLPTKCPDNATDITSDFCDATNASHVEVGGLDKNTTTASLLTIYEVAGLPKSFAPEDFLTYTGSLTTPMCDGDVTWFVWANDPIPFSGVAGSSKIEAAFPNDQRVTEPITKGNVRPLQDLTATVYTLDGSATDGALASITASVFAAVAMLVLF